MSEQNATRRGYGSGSLTTRAAADGSETWYGLWWSNGRRRKRRIGPKRAPGTRDGLTRTQAETELRRLMGETAPAPPKGGAITLRDLARRYLAHAERRGRKTSTRQNIESETRVHVVPYFGDRAVATITPQDVNDFVVALEAKDLSAKTIRNVVATLSAMLNYAKSPQRGWVPANPCDGVELPVVPEPTEIRFLTLDELDALIANAPAGEFETLDRAMWRTAAMTGLRKGELCALRWRDVDWIAQRIRVRQNWVRGEFGTPKSKRSTRSVPMAVEVARALELHSQRSRWQGDGDLVFAHPATGLPLRTAGILRRLRRALRAAGLDEAHRFHDLRHTFGTAMAAAGVPMRTLQEWMGHRDIKTTQRYADYAPSAREADMVAAAFDRRGSIWSESQSTSEQLNRAVEPNQT
jgi:integrase